MNLPALAADLGEAADGCCIITQDLTHELMYNHVVLMPYSEIEGAVMKP